MHLALYRSERPERFDEIIGQKHIVKILQNQIKTDTVRQTYLFTGTRGTGKTTTARILAKALNCTGTPADGNLPCGECENCKAIKEGRFLDVVELDAASNNSVSQIRELIDTCQFPPMFSKYKVYIIDEVHMLSQSAENAFLKTLEEPPEHVKFILATTDPEKVRETIRSRCMRLDFRRVSETDLMDGMHRICERKNINITDDALSLVAQKADGSVRDALSILEQCISGGDEKLDVKEIQDYIGVAGLPFYLELTQAVIERDMGRALSAVNQMIQSGKDAKLMLSDWMMHYRNLMVSKYVDNTEGILSASEENVTRLRAQSSQLDGKTLEQAIRLLAEYVNLGKYSTQPQILLETAILHLMNGEARPSSQVEAILKLAPKTATNLMPRMVMPASVDSVVPQGQSNQSVAQNQGTNRVVQNQSATSITSISQERDVTSASQTQMPENHMSTMAMSETSSKANNSEPTANAYTSTMTSNTPLNETAQTSAPMTSAPANETAQAESTAEATWVTQTAPAEPVMAMYDLDTMWSQIVDEVAGDGMVSFRVIIGSNSRIDEYRNGEIIIKVKPNKLKTAESHKEDILRAARKLYGDGTFVVLRPDDGIVTNQATTATPVMPDTQTRMNIDAAPVTAFPNGIPSGNQNTSATAPANSANTTDYVEEMQSEDDVASEIAEEASSLFGMAVNVVE
jgi:DNA polymerase III subunit gamma/tau